MTICERHGRLRCGECAYIAQLEEEREKLIEVLQWYADEEKWNDEVEFYKIEYPERWVSTAEKDGGQRAREILRKIGVTVE